MDQDDILEDFVSKLTGDAVMMDYTPGASAHDFTSRPLGSAPTQHVDPVSSETYNEHLGLRGPLANSEPRTQVTLIQPPLNKYRYMMEKLKHKAEGLDDQIEYIGETIEKQYGLGDTLTNPFLSSQSTVSAIGRICCGLSEDKLTPNTMVLETPRSIGLGKRVPLNLNNVKQFSLFSGQIVGIKGTNPSGRQFMVEDILTPPLPPKLERTQLAQGPQDGKPLEVIVVCGPYTLDSNLYFEPLDHFITSCISEKPDVVVFLGPFLADTHPALLNGDVDATLEDIFRRGVANRLSNLALKSPGTRICVMPHASDVLQEYNVFPQPPLDTQSLGLERVQTLPNPSLLDIGGRVFAIGNIDTLLAMTKDEVTRDPVPADRFARLARHLLQQQSFYPLFPPAPADRLESEKMTDIIISATPDFLILPSQLKPFTKVTDGVVCVNPGHLSKSLAGGTFARFVLHPSSDSNPTAATTTRVDLMKL